MLTGRKLCPSDLVSIFRPCASSSTRRNCDETITHRIWQLNLDCFSWTDRRNNQVTGSQRNPLRFGFPGEAQMGKIRERELASNRQRFPVQRKDDGLNDRFDITESRGRRPIWKEEAVANKVSAMRAPSFSKVPSICVECTPLVVYTLQSVIDPLPYETSLLVNHCTDFNSPASADTSRTTADTRADLLVRCP